MWRNFGWTAILATWTIFLIFNSGLASELAPNYPQINNKHTSYKDHQRTTSPAFDRKAIDDATLQYAKENFKSNHHSSIRTKTVFLKCKNTKNRSLRLNDYKKHIMVSSAINTPEYLKNNNDKKAWLPIKRIATENTWLSKTIIMEKLKNASNYQKFISSLRISPLISQKLKSASKMKRCKERMTYVFSNDQKIPTIRRDTRTFDGKDRLWKIFSRENGMITFFPDKFTKRSQNKKDHFIQKFKNSGMSKFKTAESTESSDTDNECERNKNVDFRSNPELMKNDTNKWIYISETKNGSHTLEKTFGNYSLSKENESRGNVGTVTRITDSTIMEKSPSVRSMTVAWTTLIFNSKISDAKGKVVDGENAVNFSKNKYSKSYKADEFPAAKIYKRDEYSKIGFKLSRDARKDSNRNEHMVNSFTFRTPNPHNNHIIRKKISFMNRLFPRKKRNALRVTCNTPSSRHEYHSSIYNIIGRRINRRAENLNKLQVNRRRKGKKITAGANYATHNTFDIERDMLLTNLSTKRIDESKLDFPTSAHISVTQKRNPTHIQYVRPDIDYERPRTTDFEIQVPEAFRTDLWNVSDPSMIVKFDGPFDPKAHIHVKYPQKFDAIDIGARVPRNSETIDKNLRLDGKSSRTSTEGESISFGATNVSDNSTEMWKINAHPSKPTDQPRLNNFNNRSENNRDTREGSRFYSRSDGVHNLKYRRYKRHEVQNTPENSISAEIDSTTWNILDTTRATSSSLIKFTADPSVTTTQTRNVDQMSTSATELVTTAGTLPFSKYQEFQWRSTPSTSTDYKRYTNIPMRMSSDGSNSLEIPLIDAPKTLNVSMIEIPTFLMETLDQSTAITKINDFITLKETPSTVEANVRVSDSMNKNVFNILSSDHIKSQERYRVYDNETISTVVPLSQRNNDPSRDTFENITTTKVNGTYGQWPVKHSAVVEGDLVLGGLMMVHEREDTITCGPVMPQGGVQALEAMLYTLDTLNNLEIVPGVKIGAHILDDCDKDTYGLEMAVDFIKGSMSNIDGAEYHCNKTTVRKVISGVVGAASSVTSIQVANLLRLFKIPQVSFFSTSPELSNKQRFEYFTRTIPSDHYQVKAMVNIVLTMRWSYVSIIYEESNYGIKAFEELEELLGKYNICIAIKEKLVKDSGVAEETAYDNIVLKLLTKPRARGCIIFGSDQEVAGVMRAVRRRNATGAFSWIGSDGWSARGLVSNGNEPEVEGTLSVQPQANPVKGFEEYFLNLTVENNRRNPWFVEFWEDHFKCQYPNASRTPYNKKYTKVCTTKERLTKQNTAFEDQLQFVSDAVMAFAYAFRDMHRDLCHGKAGLCDAMKPIKGTTLLQYLRKVDFEGLSGDKFRFDKNGDGPARYNIIHFKQTEPGKYKWVRVGKYLEGELILNMTEIQFKLGHPQPPESVCSLPCELGQAKKYVEGERCCWHCFNCTQYQIRHPRDETQCIQCRQGTLPDENHSTCQDVPEEFLRPESGWGIAAMSFSATGILVALFVCGVFLRHNDTPVVRASGRELSYVLLSGILFCYFVTFTLMLKPTDIVCGIQRFAAGFCFTVVYAALLTKTNRISRIFNAGSAKRPSFISPRSQLIICSGLVFVQILINAIWMIIDPARAMHHYPTMEDNLLVCNNYIDASYMIAFAYPTILIIVCTIYAILTRKIPEAFNESKHIGLTMYTTCVIWFAFVPLYYGTGNNVALRITSMSVTISLSASVTVVCLFSPKLYIILIRPERNVRPTRAGRHNMTKSSAMTATNASSMMGPVTATTVLTAATCDQNKAIKKHIASTIDCSTQSECYELELKDQKNGESPAMCTSRSTQTTSNEKEFVTIVTNNKESPDVIASANNKKSKNNTTTSKRLNSNARIGNGPLPQSDVSL